VSTLLRFAVQDGLRRAAETGDEVLVKQLIAANANLDAQHVSYRSYTRVSLPQWLLGISVRACSNISGIRARNHNLNTVNSYSKKPSQTTTYMCVMNTAQVDLQHAKNALLSLKPLSADSNSVFACVSPYNSNVPNQPNRFSDPNKPNYPKQL
jgi:hypothetical protein